jgi:zinc transport system substrate-binding protein
MPRFGCLVIALASVLGLEGAGSLPALAKELSVVVTIKPVHSLAVAVMEGAGAPALLLKGASSPHSYSLRPSDAKTLSTADIIVRVSDNLESFLDKPLASLSQKAKLVTLSEIPGIKLLPVRESGAFERHHDGDHDAKLGAGHNYEEHDAHLWLSPGNAAAIADRLAEVLAGARPEQADLFKANTERLKQRLAALDTELRADLAPVKGKSFVVFHDAYHYFEKHFGLEAAGSITIGPERQPGAARIRAIRAKIARAGSACVFSEPQFEPKLVRTIVEGTDARTGVLDPIGASLLEGQDQYFQVMINLAKALNGCLAEPS